VLSYKKLVIRAEGVSQYHLLQSPTVLTKLIIYIQASLQYTVLIQIHKKFQGCVKSEYVSSLNVFITVRDVTLQKQLVISHFGTQDHYLFFISLRASMLATCFGLSTIISEHLL